MKAEIQSSPLPVLRSRFRSGEDHQYGSDEARQRSDVRDSSSRVGSVFRHPPRCWYCPRGSGIKEVSAMPSITATAHLDTNRCELYLVDGEVIAFIPDRENSTASLGLGVSNYTDAEVKARQMGLEPKWE